MNNCLILTVSDVRGSRQYSVPSNIKQILYFVVSIILLVIAGTIFYIYSLQNQVSSLEVGSTSTHPITETNVSQPTVVVQETQAPPVMPKEDKLKLIRKAILLASIPNGKPFDYEKVSSPFGYRTHPITQKKDFHEGIDFPAKEGVAVYATASGLVKYAKNNGTSGNYVLMSNSYGFKSAYGHLSSYSVKKGDFVTKGQVIGYVGNSGKSIEPHLHYEVRYKNKWLNPQSFVNWDVSNSKYIKARVDSVDWDNIFKMVDSVSSLSIK